MSDSSHSPLPPSSSPNEELLPTPFKLSAHIAEHLDKMTLDEFLGLSDSETKELQRYLDAEPLAKLKFARQLKGIDVNKLGTLDKRRKQPYFAERYAQEVIPILDHIIKYRTSVDLKWRDFYPANHETVRLRIQQSMQYAIDMMDPSGAYKEVRKTFQLTPKKHALRLEVYDVNKPIKWGAATDIYSLEEITQEIQNFADEAKDGSVLILPDPNSGLLIELKPSEIKDLNDFCLRFEFLMPKIEETSVKVAKRLKVEIVKAAETQGEL